MSLERQILDANCNDCKHMIRDLAKYNSYNYLHTNNVGQIIQAGRVHYGHCQKKDMPVSFIPNVCIIETQECFEHRKGGKP